MDSELYSIARSVVYGGTETRARLARDLADSLEPVVIQLLVDTIYSDEARLIKARSLEVVGLMIALGGDAACAAVVSALPNSA